MSQFAHSSVQVIRSHRNVALATLLALLATLAVVLIIAIGSESSDGSATPSVGVSTSQPYSHPDESNVAQAVTGSSSSTTADRRPDESDVSAAIAQP